MNVLAALSLVVMGALLVLGYMVSQRIREIRMDIRETTEAMKLIAASKRLSTYLTIERKNDIAISPEQFEVNKEILLGRMIAELDEQVERGRNDHNPGSAAWEMVGGRTGFDAFVTTNVKLAASNALARLLANNDIDGARKFVHDAVAAL